jgi:cell division septal protein FtsQ
MATYIDRIPRGSQGPLFDRARVFQRGDHGQALRKRRRRRALRPWHVAALLVLLAAAFFGLDRAYLFAIGWNGFAIKTVRVRCDRPALRKGVADLLGARPLPNILLCGLQDIQRDIRGFTWVKDVQVRKVYPDTLDVTVFERVPFALLQRDGGTFLVDEDGIELQAAGREDGWDFPVVSDEGGFKDSLREKWEEARACLKSLRPDQLGRLLSLECSNDGRITLRFKDDPVRIVMDGTEAGRMMDVFDAHRAEWESLCGGTLEYVDLRLDDRVFVKPLDKTADGPSPNPPKEAE